ncbi:uromodulin-like [Anomaloglossus baeobatrachus]|uniref:uromodulin-like n=1 Tax=Anomaloglossus baeobatrachus TaxID=238106 RepID=UPI003F501147
MINLFFVLLLFTYSLQTYSVSLGSSPISTSLPSTAKKCTEKTESSSLTYLVDTTGSMEDDLAQLKKVNNWLLERASSRFPCGVRKYTMVEFNDPDIGPVRDTNSKTEFAEFFDGITAYGGLTDCPELAMGGLSLALESSPPNAFILVLTDASAKDYSDKALLTKIYSLIEKKQIQVFFLITGLCNSVNDPQFQIYRKIASKSFGHVFQVSVSDLGRAFGYLDLMLSRPVNSSTPIYSKDYPSGSHSDVFDVKGNDADLVLSFDGPITSISLVKPNGTIIKPSVSTSTIGGTVHIGTKPEEGTWRLNVTGSDEHSIRIQGMKETNVSSTSDCSKCHPDAICEEFSGRKRCSCKDGFLGDGFHCSDVDECETSWTNLCPERCRNALGSYFCGCPLGYKETSEKNCVDINECLDPKLNDCHSLATCTNTQGNYSCSCPGSHYGDGRHCYKCSDVCGQDMDCMNHGESFKCFDPCMDHSTLNEPWRSTDSPGDKHCDKDKRGWYRFIGVGGIRMAEKCVKGQSCSTEAPIWMNGSHPSPGDGIIRLTACAEYNDDCCHWSTVVQVKTCPIGYHVYKLSETRKCPFAYCTDPKSLNESCPCAKDEELRLVNGAYGCYCKDEEEDFDIHVEDLELTLKCNRNEMKASFRTCQLKHFNIKSVHLSNSSCIAVKEAGNNGLFSATTPLQGGLCGNKLYINDTHATYKNTLYVQMEMETEQLIIREYSTERSFACSYPLDVNLDLDSLLTPVISAQTYEIQGSGEFEAQMLLYKDGTFLNPYNKTTLTVSTARRLYVGVILEGQTNSHYAIVMKNCYATPSRHANDSVQYPIIKKRCANKKDPSIRVIQNGVSREGRFSLRMFKFIGKEHQIYLHCQVGICNPGNGPCKPSCSGVTTHDSISVEKHLVIKCGPIAQK